MTSQSTERRSFDFMPLAVTCYRFGLVELFTSVSNSLLVRIFFSNTSCLRFFFVLSDSFTSSATLS